MSFNEEIEPLIGGEATSTHVHPSYWHKSIRFVRWQAVIAAMITAGFLLFLRVLVLFFGSARAFKPVTPALPLPKSIQHSWAQYSPYFAVESYTVPPKGCEVTQVNIIQRHGARFPTSSAGKNIQSAVAKLKAVKTYRDPRLDFLTHFTYDLGSDDLVAFGAAQSYDSGQLDFTRYGNLVNKSNLPFVRASSSTRVVQSATNWTAGFAAAGHSKYTPSLSVVLQESGNDTLDDSMCPNAGDSDEQTTAWQTVYATPIQKRLNAAAPSANISLDDVSSLISLCPFETVAKEKKSAFCDLFSQSDFNGYEYFGDLGKYYGTGYGQALGPVQGVGYVNELLARLTGSAVNDSTQTNSTLDSSPETFPLDRSFYIDFSHDNQMVAIYSAIGLFRQPSALNVTKADPARTWYASNLVPFSARLVTERLQCNKNAYVRMFVDDALQPLKFCGSDANKMCTLQAFVQSQNYSRSNGAGDFEKCFV